jgi:uncharacterized protein YnzC (UPF0291/DUF896 family)
MEKEKLDRINFLAAKKKAEGLTTEEQKEQKALREEFLMEFRASFTGILNNTKIVRPDGSEESLNKK